MKTLYMVRHAKSSWGHDVIDHQRPLKKRGVNDSKLLSNYLSLQVSAPQKIMSSDAIRAFSTAMYFKNAFKVADEDFIATPDLYDFSGQKVLDIIKKLDNSLSIVMIVGHNHAFTSVANMLGNTYIDNVSTCGFVQIDFDEKNWNEIVTGTTQLTVFPKDLKN